MSLNVGDVIGYFSPSSPATVFAAKRFERAKQYLTEKGFHLIAGKQTSKSDFYRSGTIQERVAELNELIRNPEVRCIMSTIGGMNSNSLLPYIDYESLSKDPKIIIGYSDVTALLLGIYTQTGLVTFYGPALVASFGEFPPLVDETFSSFKEILCQGYKEQHDYKLPTHWTDEMIEWTEQSKAKTVYENNCEFSGNGYISGRMIGGNLDTILGIWGSPYMPEINSGDLLFLEDGLKDIATVERLFAFLKLNSVFDRVSAVILGKHQQFDNKGTNRQPIDVLREVLNGYHVPVVNGFDCCHTHPMLTLPIGVEVGIDFEKHQVTLLEPCVKAANNRINQTQCQ